MATRDVRIQIPRLQLLLPPGLLKEHPWPELQEFAHKVLVENVQSVVDSARANRRAFRTLYFMYVGLFVVGLGAAVATIVRSFMISSVSDAVTTFAFAGLTAASFYTLFLVRPLESLERDRIFASWLTAATNTYWTRLMYFSDQKKIDEDLVAANDELIGNLSALADRYATAIGKYPTPTNAGQSSGSNGTGAAGRSASSQRSTSRPPKIEPA